MKKGNPSHLQYEAFDPDGVEIFEYFVIIVDPSSLE